MVVLSLLKINVQSQSSVGEQPLNVRTAPRSASRCHVPRACCATTNQRSGIKCSILWAYFTTTPITCARQSRLVSVKEQRNCCCHLKKRYESKKKNAHVCFGKVWTWCSGLFCLNACVCCRGSCISASWARYPANSVD